MFQTAINLTDTPRTEYNGWSDWTTWNCALWIGGDEGFYNLAKDYRNYGDFVNYHQRSLHGQNTRRSKVGRGRLRRDAGDDGRIINNWHTGHLGT